MSVSVKAVSSPRGSGPPRPESTAPVKRRALQPTYLPYVLLAPALLLLAVITLYPAVYAGWLSLTRYTLLSAEAPHWIGLDNYVKMWSDPTFTNAVWKTVRWTVVIVALQLLLGLPIALFLNLKFRGRGIIRSIVLVPYVMPAAVVAVVWVFMFDSNFGVVNEIAVKMGILDHTAAWLSTSSGSFWLLVLAMVWEGTPLMAIILLAALQTQGREVIEASQIDGAGRWQKFRFVTIPHLLPTIWLVVMLRTMWMAHHVETIALLTNGGPGTANYTLPVYSFSLSTQDYNVAYASSIAIILSIILLLAAIVYLRQLDRSKSYL